MQRYQTTYCAECGCAVSAGALLCPGCGAQQREHDRSAAQPRASFSKICGVQHALLIAIDDYPSEVGHLRNCVADACFSGTFLDVAPAERGRNFTRRLYASLARQALTSVSNEPVSDGDAPGHSIFAHHLLSSLCQPINSVFAASDLAVRVQRLVGVNAGQLPRFGAIKYVGHEAGEFIFERCQ